MKKTEVTEELLKIENDDSSIGLKDGLEFSDYRQIIFDMENPKELRLKAFMKCCDISNESISEILNTLVATYSISSSELVKEFLADICLTSDIDILLKLNCAKSITLYSTKEANKDLGYSLMRSLIFSESTLFDCNQTNFESLNIVIQIDSIVFLMQDEKNQDIALEYFKRIITNEKIDCDYRYKTILSLENTLTLNKGRCIMRSLLAFLFDEKTFNRFRILASQYLLQHFSKELDDLEKVEKIVIKIMLDNDLDINIRADAADLLLGLGSETSKVLARDVIINLGAYGEEPVRNIYNNAQNVHTESITDSAMEIIRCLNNNLKHTEVSYKEICKEIKKFQLKGVSKKDMTDELKDKRLKVKTALRRILMDRSLHGVYNNTLFEILCKVWVYMKKSEFSEEIQKRLIEELIDMSGTCSTGYVTRLVNSISSFGDFNIKISWEDQIISNFSGRLNAKIKDLKDDDIKGEILIELVSKDPHKPHLFDFMVKNLSKIREEMYNEFREYMEDTDFDLFFKKAVMTYEK